MKLPSLIWTTQPSSARLYVVEAQGEFGVYRIEHDVSRGEAATVLFVFRNYQVTPWRQGSVDLLRDGLLRTFEKLFIDGDPFVTARRPLDIEALPKLALEFAAVRTQLRELEATWPGPSAPY